MEEQASAAARTLRVETPESVAFAYELAGLGSRGLALALDMLLLGLVIAGEVMVAGLVLLGVGFATSWETAGTVSIWVGGAVLVLAFVTWYAYFVYGEVARGGRTWGKRRLGLRVVREDGSRIGVLDSIIRTFLRIVDGLPGNYAVGMAGVLFTAKRQRLGDMAAGTVVVRDSGELVAHFQGGDVSKQVLLAREFLSRRGSLTPAARQQVAQEVLRALGEEADPAWDEPTTAGRIAELSR